MLPTQGVLKMVVKFNNVKNGQFFSIPAFNANLYKMSKKWSIRFMEDGSTRKVKNDNFNYVILGLK